jgi:hypothetical protein
LRPFIDVVRTVAAASRSIGAPEVNRFCLIRTSFWAAAGSYSIEATLTPARPLDPLRARLLLVDSVWAV